MTNYTKNNRGFTLVELSIVLVIIGLLLAGVLQGKEMVRSAELKSMVSTVQEYNSALSQFEYLYEALPGDMANATSYWNSSANGNGDLSINAETSDEPFLAIEHLINAQLLPGEEGDYTATWGSGFVLDGNVPNLERAGAGIYVKCCGATTSDGTLDINNHVNIFSIDSSDSTLRAGIVTPIEAKNIDSKFDDGIPDFGLVGSIGNYADTAYAITGCFSGAGSTSAYLSADATYKEAEGCQMMFAYDWD